MDTRVVTAFREHYEHCRSLDVVRQLHECADHLQNPTVLLLEFFESYHLIERSFAPGSDLRPGSGEDGELVLESFYESLELTIRGGENGSEKLVCVSGSMSPIPEGQHPALSHQGLDYVGLRTGETTHLVLGVVQASKEETPYVMLLRALNCFAELSPPFRVVQLGREMIRGPVPEDLQFDLQIGITEMDASDEWLALIELTRDLAELFARQIAQEPQFSGVLGCIECVEIETDSQGIVTLDRVWRV